jgi:sec-independent protein translocase protein TatC
MTNSSQPDHSLTARLEESGGQMTFFEHLTELRKRIINSLYAIGIGAFIGVYISPKVIRFINEPALYKHERSAVTGFLFSTVFLFLAGIAFGYFVTLPYMLRFLVGFQQFGGSVAPLLSINEYFDLILIVLLGLGLVFELPILIFFLTLFGIVTPKFLWSNFRYAIAIIAIVAAIITPTPDAQTMLIFMAPMVGLYFVGIAVSAVVLRNKKKRLAAESAGTSA